MGKRSKRQPTRSQPQESHRERGGFPQIIQQARKTGTRVWRAITRHPLFSLPNLPKDINRDSPSALESFIESPQSFEHLPPRPAPYFYPRFVNALSHSDQRPTPVKPCSLSICRYNILADSALGDNTGYDGESDRASIPSVDSVEIGSWKEKRNDYLPTVPRGQDDSLRGIRVLLKSEPDSSPRVRYASSEVDLRKLQRKAKEPGDIGPGISNDPFAAFPQANVPGSTLPHLRQTLSRRKTPFPKSFAASGHSTIETNKMDSNSNPFRRMRLGSMESRQARTHQPVPVKPNPLSISIPPPSADHHHRQLIFPSSPTETPSLTPDRPSFSSQRRMVVSPSDTIQSLSSVRTSDTYLTAFDTCYGEGVLEEETNDDVDVFEGVATPSDGDKRFEGSLSAIGTDWHIPQPLLGNKYPSKTSGRKNARKDPKKFIPGEGVFTVDPDLASLTEDWPLPPRRTLFLDPARGMSWQRVSREVEFFKPSSLDAPRRRLRVVSHSSSNPDISALAEDQHISRLLQYVESEPHLPCVGPSSPPTSVVAVLGNAVLEHESFPSVIDLQPRSEQYRPVMLVVRAANPRTLISFCTSRGATVITASPHVEKGSPMQAHVRLRRGPKKAKGNEAAITLFVEVHHTEPGPTLSFNTFPQPFGSSLVRLPVTLGALSVMIPKRADRISGAATQDAPQSL